jgi:sterol desaturase/sphingolipid hydroxylase (fatty acid hydroxylase superfamily)
MAVQAKTIYEASLQPSRGALQRLASATRLVAGLCTLIWLGWAKPFGEQLLNLLRFSGVSEELLQYIGTPLVMVVRAVIIVEVVGYAYHRFCQHVGWLTKRSHFSRYGQRFHWLHHMVHHPIGKFYHRRKYLVAEPGIGLSLTVPSLLVGLLFVLTHDRDFATVCFLGGMFVYGKFVLEKLHARYHENSHSWGDYKWFQWLERYHRIHHVHQSWNYSVCNPLIDMLFGTYRNPNRHPELTDEALIERELSVSDIVNWRILLMHAGSSKHAAYVSLAQKHPRSIRKLHLLVQVLDEHLMAHRKAAAARELRNRAWDLLVYVGRAARP